MPRSIADPLATHRANVDGFVNMLFAAKEARVSRFVYASSSSVYGDSKDLPKREEKIGNQLSPYAVSKRTNELYADVFSRVYELSCVGLRYFNVFGPRQDPHGAYAAVIPRWLQTLTSGGQCTINGDGETSRDFCFVANAVQANLLSACTDGPNSRHSVYNIAVGEQMSLSDLYGIIRDRLLSHKGNLIIPEPKYGPFRPGDVRHSLADISSAKEALGYEPTHRAVQGLRETVDWYVRLPSPQ